MRKAVLIEIELYLFTYCIETSTNKTTITAGIADRSR